MDHEKKEIAGRLRGEIVRTFGSIKAFADAIGKTQQYVNVYLSGINSPGPKMRTFMKKAGLDVAFIMTGRRGEGDGAEHKELNELKAVMEERGIRNARELRNRLLQEEALRRMLGSDAYNLMVRAAAARDRRAKYRYRKRGSE